MPDQIPHTLTTFEDSLKELKQSLLLMGSTAAENLQSAVNGLLSRDTTLCNAAIAEDEVVNTYERTIDEDGMSILMRYNPLATDLRLVVGAMKIATNLERVSDLAGDVARRAKKTLKQPERDQTRLIEPIFQQALDLLNDAMRAFAEGDIDLALSLHDRDKELDASHKKATKKLTADMEEDSENVRIYLNLIFILRCLERVGDHAVNIGEDAIYVYRAADIRHVGPSALEEEE